MDVFRGQGRMRAVQSKQLLQAASTERCTFPLCRSLLLCGLILEH